MEQKDSNTTKIVLIVGGILFTLILCAAAAYAVMIGAGNVATIDMANTAIDSAHKSAWRNDLSTINNALHIYNAENEGYPINLNELIDYGLLDEIRTDEAQVYYSRLSEDSFELWFILPDGSRMDIPND